VTALVSSVFMPTDPRLFGETAVRHGFLTREQLAEALEHQRTREPGRTIGQLLIDRGLLSRGQADAIEKLRTVLESAPGVAPDENELIGKALKRSLILEQIGSGGMGTTYRAHHLKLDRDVAIKVLHPRLVKVRGFLTRFEREARSAAKLEHPGIVQVYDFDEEAGFHFIVMQFVEGQNLREVLYRKGRLGTRRTVWIGSRVLEALAHAHGFDIVHRDIKPANLIITKEPRVKITDFGLVRLLSATTSDRLSAFGEILGTPQYMSPEQACAGDVDARADLYSLGITMFELLTGRPPFVGKSTMDVLQKQILAPLPKLHDQREPVPPELQAFVEKLTAKDPANRFATAQEALDALRAVRLEDRPTGAILSIAERGDASRVVPAPPVVTREALDDLKRRVQRPSLLELAAFELDEENPSNPEETAHAGDVPPSTHRALREAAAQGRIEATVNDLLGMLWKQGRDAEILSLERELEAVCPTLPASEFFLGLAYERRKEWENARAKFALTVALAPDHLPARLNLARVLTELSRIDEAAIALEQAVAFAPTSPQAAARLAEFLYLVRRDAAAAVPAYERAVELDPGRWQLRQQLGWILFELGRNDEAEDVLREVVEWTNESAPRELLERIERARPAAPAGPKSGESSSGTAGASASASAKISASLDLIHLAIASGRWDRVAEIATQGLALKPRAVPLLLARARANYELQAYAEAVNDYGLALSLSPTNPEANEGLVRAQQARRSTKRIERTGEDTEVG
jgi:serine/threonine protein kinase/Flp pilus assembly protein TadD